MPERLGITPSGVMQGNERSIDMREAPTKLHLLQEFAVEADYARGFFAACQRNAKGQLPWLIQKNLGVDKKDLRSQHIFGLYDAYQAMQGSLEAKRKFELDWGDQSDYLQSQVERILPELDREREKAHSHPEKIEPYDVKLAERKAKRALVHLPKDERALFAEMSGINVEKRWRRYAEKGVSMGLSTASLFGADAAAGAAAAPVEGAHLHVLESPNIGLLIAAEVASYGFLIYGIAKHVHANRQLSKEENITINAGYTMGKMIAESAGASEAVSEKTSVLSQYGSEFVKDSIWNAAIGTAVATGQLTIRDALILSTFANLGGTAYELLIAAGAHGVLKAKRAVYNRRHPFHFDEEERTLNTGVPGNIQVHKDLSEEKKATNEKDIVSNCAI